MNMVGENSSGGGSDIGDPDSSDVSKERQLETDTNTVATAMTDTSATVATVATAASTAAVTSAVVTATTIRSPGRIFNVAEDQATTFAVDDGVVSAPSIDGNAYCEQSMMPRWHTPHVGIIGSEI